MRLILPLLLLVAVPAAAEELFNKRVAIVEEFPREVARGKELIISGRHVGAYKTPELIVIAPDGRTYKNFKGIFDATTFAFEVEFTRGVGVYSMEIMLRTNKRYRSAARFKVWYGKKKPKRYVDPPLPEEVRTPVSINVRLVEKRVLGYLNRLRKQSKLKPVAWNEAVAARARDHASKMAKVQRRVHKFGNTGVVQMLEKDGAGQWAPESGPANGWPNVTSLRPFGPPQIRSTNDHPLNHVVDMMICSTSLNVMWERFFGRLPAFRLLAADPYCLEVGFGCARSTKGNKQIVYYCICFVQVNDKLVRSRQNSAYDKLLRETTGTDPKRIRRLAHWQRPKTTGKKLRAFMRSDRADIVGAAIDGLLVLDEEKTRKTITKADDKASVAENSARHGDAYRFFEALANSYYDLDWRARGRKRIGVIAKAAKAELDQIEMLGDPKEMKKELKDLARRCKGMPILDKLE